MYFIARWKAVERLSNQSVPRFHSNLTSSVGKTARLESESKRQILGPLAKNAHKRKPRTMNAYLLSLLTLMRSPLLASFKTARFFGTATAITAVVVFRVMNFLFICKS